MNVDLHSHSTASDGALPPADLVRRAAAHGVEMLALTDHDRLDGLAEARTAARQSGIRFIEGVEVSVTWRGQSVHVLGLGIDPFDPALQAALAALRSSRFERAQRMAAQLAAAGIRDCLEGALRYARDPACVGRLHFAHHLVAAGAAVDTRAAFRRFLRPGKPGYVAVHGAALADAVRWIGGAGGRAALAHPARYALSAGALRTLLEDFRAAGGQGLEVVSGSHSSGDCSRFTALALRHGFAATRGSDFHGPGGGAEPGALPALDPALLPIWSDWLP